MDKIEESEQHHQRRSIRLKGYDYAQPGYYFVTICVQDRLYLLARIRDEQAVLTEAGQMIADWCNEIPKKFEYTSLDTYVIMPNHFHAIIQIHRPVGADLCVCPRADSVVSPDEKGEHAGVNAMGEHTGSPLRMGVIVENNGLNAMGEHTGSPLHRMVQWFKTMTTNDYIKGVKHSNWPAFRQRLWQRNYYEHIIRNEEDLFHAREYIRLNPMNWSKDTLYQPGIDDT